MKRSTPEAEEDIEKPRARKRLKSMSWGLGVDNMLLATSGAGLEQFDISAHLEDPASDPCAWPMLHVTPDQGPDGLCCLNSLRFGGLESRVFNIDVHWDPSHGAHNDLKLSLKRCGLWYHELLACVAGAAPFSPFGDGTRRCQVQEAMGEYFATYSPETCPVFMDIVPLLLLESGEPHRIAEDSIASELWDNIKDDVVWRERGTKLSLSRFQSIVPHAIAETSQWSKRFLSMLYTCLQLGILDQKMLMKAENQVKGSAPNMGRTTTQRDEVRNMRQLTTNNLAIATLFYANYENKTKQLVIATAARPIFDWHVKQNKAIRSTQECAAFTLRQLRGDWLEPLRSLFKQTMSTEALEQVGVVQPLTASFMKQYSADHGDIAWMDEVSTMLGNLCTSLVACRARRRQMGWGGGSLVHVATFGGWLLCSPRQKLPIAFLFSLVGGFFEPAWRRTRDLLHRVSAAPHRHAAIVRTPAGGCSRRCASGRTASASFSTTRWRRAASRSTRPTSCASGSCRTSGGRWRRLLLPSRHASL